MKHLSYSEYKKLHKKLWEQAEKLPRLQAIKKLDEIKNLKTRFLNQKKNPEKKDKWVIIDWAGNRMFPKMEFDSFEEGWEYIYANIEDEEEYQDIYVLRKSEVMKNPGSKSNSKIHKVMREFKEGALRDSSGKQVKNRKQAVAIAMSEAGLSRKNPTSHSSLALASRSGKVFNKF